MYYESYLTVQNIEESIIDLKHKIIKMKSTIQKMKLVSLVYIFSLYHSKYSKEIHLVKLKL